MDRLLNDLGGGTRSSAVDSLSFDDPVSFATDFLGISSSFGSDDHTYLRLDGSLTSANTSQSHFSSKTGSSPKTARHPTTDPSEADALRLAVSPTSSSERAASCQCLISALTLLETLAIESARPSAPTVARILHFKKRALAQCNTLLDCRRCSSVSSFIMLLVILCEKMITSYEQVLAVLTEQYNLRQSQLLGSATRYQPVESGNDHAALGLDEERQVAVKDYDLDMEEQPCVFGGLASMQMRKLKTFLARVKTVLRQCHCDLHVVMVDSVGERLRQQLRLFDKSSNEA